MENSKLDKQIEQMAKTVCHLDRTCDQCMTSFECKAMMYAKRFYNAGYRKAYDVAREMIKAIKDEVSKKEQYISYFDSCGVYVIATTDLEDIIRRYMFDTYEEAELKKKYTEEGK